MRTLTRAAMLAAIIAVAVACGSSKSSTATSNATTGASTTTAAGASKAPSGGLDTNAFCAKLAAETEETAGLAAAIGTPDQDAKVAAIKAANADIEASAPAEVADAVNKFYAISELASNALLTSNAADKVAAVKAAADAAKDPAVKAAIADYGTWVKANCGDQATKIMGGGL